MRLDALVRRISEEAGSGLRVAAAEEWTGLAREAHDECVQRLSTQLDLARSSLERAASESNRAAATLVGRV